jgi:hypothetical protein
MHFFHPMVPTGLIYYKFPVLNKTMLGSYFVDVLPMAQKL